MSFRTRTRAQALGAFGAIAVAAPALSCCAVAADRIGASDTKALGDELARELAAIAAYQAAAALKIASAPVQAVLNQFQADHGAHRDALIAIFTNAGQQAPTNFVPLPPASLKTEHDVLASAYALERLLADGHLSAVPVYGNRDYAKTAASILGVETTHVALLAEALRQSPAYPSSFVSA